MHLEYVTAPMALSRAFFAMWRSPMYQSTPTDPVAPKRLRGRRDRSARRFCDPMGEIAVGRPVNADLRIQNWSGARDLNPGPHGPESHDVSSSLADFDRLQLETRDSSGRSAQIWINLQPDCYIDHNTDCAAESALIVNRAKCSSFSDGAGGSVAGDFGRPG